MLTKQEEVCIFTCVCFDKFDKFMYVIILCLLILKPCTVESIEVHSSH